MKNLFLNCALTTVALALSAIGTPMATPALAQQAPTAAVETVDVDPALWVVKDADTTVYLFGTVHILKPGMGWFDEAVKDAFDKSDRLVLEMVEPDAATTQQLFAKYGLDTSGKPLTSKMTEDEKAIYAKAMEKVGLPVAAFEPLDPWAAAVTMQIMGLQKGGYDVNSGVETQLTAAAKASGKPIAGVETMESQLAIFDTLSQETQVRFLVESAKTVDDMTASMDNMVALWAKPDPDGLAQVMNEGLSDPKLHAALLTNRNANWAAWISKQLEKPGTTFMAVGAGHLSGSTSVPHLLTAYGIQAQRVEY
ncbi:TraB/GumN family protein [uncultured Sphingorhabdus sp.]|uniref:TraB/GumN family protein n=1 Tax=uncultured Sphingorhabdus sp. TaxID=1686106 RepID=UPI0026178623|nr:TraB/GumN family protein [uncultured Sphingorhabdus sp.]HMS20242.1 TraB/GumN family protein [Sphingorhabdus sp.]